MKKLISILFIIIILTVFCSSVVLADPVKAMGGGITNPASGGVLNKVAGQVLKLVQVIGIGVAVIMIVIIAIKFMMAAPAEKADVKKQLVGYTIGVIIIVAVVGLLQIFASMGAQVSNMAML